MTPALTLPTLVVMSATQTSFEEMTVADAMHPEVLTCPADAPLRLVAATMAGERVHCIVVEGTGGDARGWALVSSLDLITAGSSALDEGTAGGSAASEFLTVSPDEKLGRAARIMVEHEAAQVVVVDASDRPVGVLSTLDVADAMVSGEGSFALRTVPSPG
jgi:CBS domain-containing protein